MILFSLQRGARAADNSGQPHTHANPVWRPNDVALAWGLQTHSPPQGQTQNQEQETMVAGMCHASANDLYLQCHYCTRNWNKKGTLDSIIDSTNMIRLMRSPKHNRLVFELSYFHFFDVFKKKA